MCLYLRTTRSSDMISMARAVHRDPCTRLTIVTYFFADTRDTCHDDTRLRCLRCFRAARCITVHEEKGTHAFFIRHSCRCHPHFSHATLFALFIENILAFHASICNDRGRERAHARFVCRRMKQCRFPSSLHNEEVRLTLFRAGILY